MTKHKCATKVHGTYRASGAVYPCLRPATVERDGQWYCWQHDPERVKADAAKRKAVWEAKQNRQADKYARRTRTVRLARLVTPELAELLELLANAVDTTQSLGLAQMTYTARSTATRIRELTEETNDANSNSTL